MKILITGAGGRVGRVLRQELARDHRLRLLDICAIEHPEGEAIQGSVTDLETSASGRDTALRWGRSTGMGS